MYRRTGRGRASLLVFLALSIVVITLDFRDDTGGPLDGARAASTAAIAPLQEAVGTVLEPVGDFFSSLANLGSLREENARLRERLAQMEQRVAEADSIVSENRRLVALNGLDAAYPSMKRVSARVIGRPPANYRWAVTIDLGSNDGIAADMPVIHPHGLVGKVLSVDASTATVLLLVDPASAAKARVGAHGAVGAITGNGGGQPLSLSFIDVDAQVRVGDAVLTSGYDGAIFPPSIPIGTVTAVESVPGALEQSVTVRPYVDLEALDLVQVITDSRRERRAP
jgi:rod shape-determining protein MreC